MPHASQVIVLLVLGICWLSSAQAACPLPDKVTSSPAVGTAAVDVSIGLYLMDLSKVDDVAQSFKIDLYADVIWHDNRLGAIAKAADAPCIYALNDIWHPALTFRNRREGATILPSTATVSTNGSVLYTQRFLGEVASPLDLRKFPYDRQEFPIELGSPYASEQVHLELDPRRTGASEHLSVAGWNIVDTQLRAEVTQLNIELDGEPARISTVTYAFLAERNINYYLWKVALPITVISVMSWAVFWINRRELGPILAASSTATLTLIAFMFSLRGIQPPVSYLTHMDFFIYGSLLLLFLTHFEGLLSHSLTEEGKTTSARNLDRLSRVGFPCCFVCLLLWYLFSA